MGAVVSLKRNGEFRRVYSRGKYIVSPILVTYVLKNKKNIVRVGITTSKKVGNAVLRNRSKRIIMASVRDLLPLMKGGYDLVFVARAKTPYCKSYDISKFMKKHLTKMGVLYER